jgi:protein-tyrosine phosphatase
MIDLHSHILPGLDDGAATAEESLALAGRYVSAGFTVVVATPHCVPGTHWMPSPETVEGAVADLNRRLGAAGTPLKVLAGMEVALDPSIVDLIDAQRLLTLGGSNYLLVEPPFQRLPIGWKQILFDIQARNLQVLMAHPERCAQMMGEQELFEVLLENGIYTQFNWTSLAGTGGAQTRKAARHLLRRGFVHCLGTDSHDARNRHAGIVRDTAAALRSDVGDDMLRTLTVENPKRILAGRPLARPARVAGAPAAGRKRWWRWW